jgi:hypothetical protein
LRVEAPFAVIRSGLRDAAPYFARCGRCVGPSRFVRRRRDRKRAMGPENRLKTLRTAPTSAQSMNPPKIFARIAHLARTPAAAPTGMRNPRAATEDQTGGAGTAGSGCALVPFFIRAFDRAVIPVSPPSCIVSSAELGTKTIVAFCLSPS